MIRHLTNRTTVIMLQFPAFAGTAISWNHGEESGEGVVCSIAHQLCPADQCFVSLKGVGNLGPSWDLLLYICSPMKLNCFSPHEVELESTTGVLVLYHVPAYFFVSPASVTTFS
eukprot:TRINITY_DN3485_c3_g1_i1.p1 TRINITY_DN3485_c3_g1~~TRINITY_DN3485_c3_g1_i1.p1  ORF type:complete len:114 (+),score=12.11 TRINITY_DN3485_c3_g1_i1:546-887(+)